MSERLLRAREVAELLGMSTAWVLDKWERNEIPGFRVSSRAIRFRESEVLAWLEQRRGHSYPAEVTSSQAPNGVA